MTTSKGWRDTVRLLAADILRSAHGPLHNREIVAALPAHLSESSVLTPKSLNTMLHDDPSARFERVAPGTWVLRRN
jgi:hypothetical protein